MKLVYTHKHTHSHMKGQQLTPVVSRVDNNVAVGFHGNYSASMGLTMSL